MDYFQGAGLGRVFALRLDRGDDIVGSLKTLLEKEGVRDAAVISGIGTVDRCVLHFVDTVDDPARMTFKRWEQTPLEVAGIQGLVAGGEPHLHAVVSDQHSAWAGHVEPGCRTLYLCEMLVVELTGLNLARVHKQADPAHIDYPILELRALGTL